MESPNCQSRPLPSFGAAVEDHPSSPSVMVISASAE
eukprot:symbB.v1.2.041245.t1/scaffold7969.1/size8393/1